MSRKKVLITGAAGRIGQVLREGLQDRYDLRVLYNRTVLPQQETEEIRVGSITDLATMEQVVAGCDAVIHMAGNPSVQAPFEDVHLQNSLGTYCLYEACVRQKCSRVIFASTNHVTGEYEKDGIYTTPDMPVRPDSFYGASKAHGEALGRYYADNFDLGVVCLRIGSFQPLEAVTGRKSDRILSTWLSHRDTVQMCWRGIEATQIKFGIYYGISGNKRAYWDIQNAIEELGYAPQDNAEDHA
jgi:nucleoside-diphosphate-sugar epimerase